MADKPGILVETLRGVRKRLAIGIALVACHSHGPQTKPEPDAREPGVFQERQLADDAGTADVLPGKLGTEPPLTFAEGPWTVELRQAGGMVGAKWAVRLAQDGAVSCEGWDLGVGPLHCPTFASQQRVAQVRDALRAMRRQGRLVAPGPTAPSARSPTA
jgi:hypothetical protein